MKKHFLALVIAFSALTGARTVQAQSIYEPYFFTTLAGLALNFGSIDATGSAARFYQPWGLAVDSAGNVYVADTLNHTIRKIAPGGIVTTLAGSVGVSGTNDGPANAAQFSRPTGVAVNSAGTVVYVADYNNHLIRQISGGVVTTLAGSVGVFGTNDGTGVSAQFRNPFGVAVNIAGTAVYVADQNNQTIRMITVPGAVVTTLAGSPNLAGSANGANSVARFNTPRGIAIDSAGNLYVADAGNFTVRKILSGGGVSTLAGQLFTAGYNDGPGSGALFSLLSGMSPFGGPCGVAVDGGGNVYVTDQGNHTIRKITPGGSVTTLAGSVGVSGSADGTGIAARFNYPGGVAVDGVGKLYVADTSNHTIRTGVNTNTNPCPDFVVNGSFEMTSPAMAPSTSNNSLDPTTGVPGWTTAASNFLEIWCNNVGIPASLGTNQLEINAQSVDETVSQVVTGLSTNCPATFCFDYTGRFGLVSNTYNNDFTVTLSGGYSLSVPLDPAAHSVGGWTNFCVSFLPTASTVTIAFRGRPHFSDGTAATQGGAHIDNVSLTQCCDTVTCITMSCSRDKTVECGNEWTFDPPANIVDACCTNFALTILSTVTNGACPALVTRTWLVSDTCGNSNTCSQTVTVANTMPPMFTNCQLAEQWSATGSLITGHASHKAILLPNGKVLVAGDSINVELYDPATELWTATGPLNTGGSGKTLTLLSNGKVLIAGGGYPGTGGILPPTIPQAGTEVYDPATGIWTPTGLLNNARDAATAILLGNGQVLIAGGAGSGNGNYALSTTELYNPGTGTWTLTGSLNTARAGATATLLANGHVLIAGGGASGGPMSILSTALGSAEDYNPGTGVWTPVGALNIPRNFHTAALLGNGLVLVAGGWNGSVSLSTAELYNPGTGTWALTGSLNTARYAAMSTLLANGKVLVAGGGSTTTSVLASAELYDPSSGTWTATAPLNTARSWATATLLDNGQVLAAGGNSALSSAELYGRANLGCNPSSIPDFDPAVVANGCGVTVSYAKVDTTNGCMRSRTITYTAVDSCNNSNTCAQSFVWKVNATPPVFTCATNKTVECGSCSGTFAFTLLHSFPTTTNDGLEPHASLIQASDGKLYGVTASGGSSSNGTVFSINPDGSGYTLLKSFMGTNGASPYRALIEGADFMLYGTTKFGGSSGYGTVFRMTKDASFYQVLVHFNIGNGSHPWASLLQASDGLLYGTTYDGGYGNIFKLNPDGTGFSVIHNFANADGGHPTSGLVEGNGGVLFGTTTFGGSTTNAGTIYKINKDGSGFQVLKVLGGSDGDTAFGCVTIGSDGFLYGTTAYGGVANGISGNGTIYKLKQDGTGFTVLRAFASVNDGRVSYSTLVEDSDGMLWGTSSEGYYTSGSIFRIKKDGSDYRIIKNLGGSTGGVPIQGLLRGSDGAFYGTASEFLASGSGGGTIFKLACASMWDFDVPTAVDACSGAGVTVSVLGTQTNAAGTCSQHITRIWLATDLCGNSNTCSQTVTVADTTPPTLTCAGDKTVDCASRWAFDAPTASDTCSGSKITVSILRTVTNGICPRTITQTWAAADLCGNSNTCSQTVTLRDTQPPVITCPTNRIIVALDANCQLEIPTIRPSASDNCTPASQLVYTQNPSAGAIVPGPCQLVTVTVRDACDNASQCQVLVCGQDKTPPTLIYPKSVTVTNCIMPNVLALVSAFDNCTASNQLVFTQSPPAGTAIAAGGNFVSVTVTDLNGNATTVVIPLTSGGTHSFLDVMFNTAVDSNKAVLPYAYPTGSVDPHYTLGPVPAGTPTGPGYYNAPNAIAFPIVMGLPPFTSSAWIVPGAEWAFVIYPPGFYTYTNQFVLPPGMDPLTASISGRWAADDSATMYLNGLAPANQVSSMAPIGYNHWTYFTVNSGFLAFPAINKLYFVVTNAPIVPPDNTVLTALRVEFTDASINCSTCTPPVILHKTPSQSLPLNSTAVFSVSVWGTPPLTLQWYHNGLPLTHGVHYPNGVTNTTLTITPLGYADAGIYTVAVSNSCGGTASVPAKLTITHGWPWWWAWWNFSDIRNPMKATVGPDLIMEGTNIFGISSGTTLDFGLPNIGGQIANVLYVPPLPAGTFIKLPFFAPPGSDSVSNYTLIMDVYFSDDSTNPVTLFNLVNDHGAGFPQDSLRLRESPTLQSTSHISVQGMVGGVSFNLDSTMPLRPGDWNRVALVCLSKDYSDGLPDGLGLSLYLNGQLAGSTSFNATPGALAFRSNSLATVFSSPDGTGGGLYASSLQFHTVAFTPEMIAGMGSPGDGPIPANDPSMSVMPPVLLVNKSPTGINFMWDDPDGGAFFLEETSDLGSGEWMESFLPFDQSEVNGEIRTTAHANPALGGPAKFYRLIYTPGK